MPKPTTPGRNSRRSDQQARLRPSIRWAASVVLGISAGALAALLYPFGIVTTGGPSGCEPQAAPLAERAGPPETVPAAPALASLPPAPADRGPAPPAGELLPPSQPVEPAMADRVAALRVLSNTNLALTPEALAAWQTNLAELVRSGPAAVPALHAFLAEKTDFPFSREAWESTGCNSARIAAIEALRQIGGPEAIAVMYAMLGPATSPRELAVLARNLEESSPGQYRQQALDAARASLQTADTASNPELDVAPLFEIFQHYGDANVVAELENSLNRWKYYAAVALANLPEGAGIPSILRLADSTGGSGNRVVALELVAQLAASNPAAREFLAKQVQASLIPQNIWPYLASPLCGDQYFPVDSAITPYPALQSWSDLRTTHLSQGNQNLYSLPADQALAADAINQRLALVDELMQSATDPAAQQTLKLAREVLTRRASRTAARTTADLPDATGG